MTPVSGADVRVGRTARNSGWMLGAEVGRFVVRGAFWVLLARTLGPEGFGSFAGALAWVSIFTPLVSFGAGHLLIRDVARDAGRFPAAWRAFLTLMASGALLFTVTAVLGAMWLFPGFDPTLILCLALSEYVAGRLVEGATQVFQGFERLYGMGALHVFFATVRLVALVVFNVVSPQGSLLQWVEHYLVASLVGAIVAIAWVTVSFGRPAGRTGPLIARARSGLAFSFGQSAAALYNDVDKAMLLHFGLHEAAGIYAAGARVVDLAFAPVRAVLFATYARFFKVGAQGLGASTALARRMLPWTCAWGLLAAVGLLLGAPVGAQLLGEGYLEVAEVIRWLAWVPLLRGVHYLAADALTGAGYQLHRTAIQLLVGGLNVGLNLWLIPRFGWQGAAAGTLACEVALVVWLLAGWWILHGTRRRSHG